MFDPNSPDTTRPVQELAHDGPEMPAFIRRHRYFFVLLAVVTVQILLLSLQIIRNNHVRLIRYWAVRALIPLSARWAD